MNGDLHLPPQAQYNSELEIYDLDWSDVSSRKSSGSYYTPVCLIECLLDHALNPRIEQLPGAMRGAMPTLVVDMKRAGGTTEHAHDKRGHGTRCAVGMKRAKGTAKHAHDKRGHGTQDGTQHGTRNVQKSSHLSPLSPLPFLCDPACGTGHFLVPAAKRLAKMLERPLEEVISQCIYGVDLDPAAVELCRLNLWLAAGKPAKLRPILERRIRRDDSLFMSWRETFPEVFASGGFDAVIGNPPFVNAIEGSIPRETKKRLAAISDELRGTADLAFHFVRLSHELAKADGTIGLVLPKTFLNAEAAVKLRERLCRERPPSMIHVPRKAVYFSGASAYTCLLVLGGDAACSISDDESPTKAAWRRGTISHANWWRSVQTILGHLEELPPGRFVPLAEHFEVTASMTAGDAYTIKPYISDRATGKGLKLVTTGLIDPFECKWGREACRYLGSVYARPKVAANGHLPPALAARLHKAATRPKLLVAGLCDRFEAFLDRRCEYVGAVSTYSIFHSENEVELLAELCDWLNSPLATDFLRAELGAASVGGGFMTLKKKTLQALPFPKRIVNVHGP